MNDHGLLDAWEGPLDGVPAFDRVDPEHFLDAFAAATAAWRREIADIVANPAPPTFDNVLVKLDRAGALMTRFTAYYGVWTSTLKDERVRAIEAEIEPRRAGLRDELIQNAALFAKLEAIVDARDPGLTEEQRRLLEVRHREFVLQGARLDAAGKERVAEINQRLATLYTQFNDHVLADEARPALVVDDPRGLDGMPPEFVRAAAAEAERLGLKNKFVVANTRSSAEPFLMFAHRRDLRREVFKAWSQRGAEVNGPIIREVLELRAELARRLGFASFAHWTLADKMIDDPARATDLMMKVWRPALARARRDIAEMQDMIARDGDTFALAPWDYRYYAERVRRAKFDLDPEVVRPYLNFEGVRDAMFAVAGALYGLTFRPIDAPVYHPDVRAFEVTDARGVVGGFYLDPFARPGKASGAWMSALRPQGYDRGRRQPPLVTNTSNFIKGPPGRPVLLSWDDARTMFHEFGHALHGLLSDVDYLHLQGTSVATDYVEFPSHFHENYLKTDRVLARLLDERGRALPREVIDKLQRSSTFNQAFATLEFLGCALVDMHLHAGPPPTDPAAAARTLLADLEMPAEIALRHDLPHFAHAFASDAYAAGYYSYLWSDVMASDGFEAFTEAGDPFDATVARRLRDCVLAAGNRREPGRSYRDFRGRDADVNALLRARDLI